MYLKPDLNRLEKCWINIFKNCTFWWRNGNSKMLPLKITTGRKLEMPLFWGYQHLSFGRDSWKQTAHLHRSWKSSVERAIVNSEAYSADNETSYQPASASVSELRTEQKENQKETDSRISAASKSLLKEMSFFCGGTRHHRNKCLAWGTSRYNCQKEGHFAKVCCSNDNKHFFFLRRHPRIECPTRGTTFFNCKEKSHFA